MNYTDWTNPGIVFGSIGGGQAWTNPTNVGATNDNARATLPSSTGWSTSQVIFPLSGTIDWTSILPENAVVQELFIRIHTQAAGILSGPPYRTWNVSLATTAGLVGTPIQLSLNSQGAGNNWRTLGGALSAWGTDLGGISGWMTNAAAAVFVTNGGSSGTIGLDALAIQLGYTLPVTARLIAGTRGLRIGSSIGL